MKIVFSNAVFDILKWMVIVVIPATATAYVGLASIWHWPFADEVAKTSAVLCAFLGAILGISNLQYKQEQLRGVDEVDGIQGD